ncbi:hypothetical protein HNQ07_002710 [Deinococcus metalli]|uniref:Uncharacterized protein n=1 Tax=Deinococcus metalli TaxID=1141878 RepID=A0A7W8KFM9_9DEIO|nr:hypothetical protein [Deinococcus metalli]MBB5377237.1 hypothetical protein [Deinococcus metalli]GHF47971.1 hypothetical protein GCM10017781_25390 [Deinococcus metalli]
MLNTLFFPLLFSMGAGSYAYLRFRDRRPNALLVMTLFQLLGAYGYFTQPVAPLFMLLALHATVVFFLLVHHLQAPTLAPETRTGPRR